MTQQLHEHKLATRSASAATGSCELRPVFSYLVDCMLTVFCAAIGTYVLVVVAMWCVADMCCRVRVFAPPCETSCHRRPLVGERECQARSCSSCLQVIARNTIERLLLCCYYGRENKRCTVPAVMAANAMHAASMSSYILMHGASRWTGERRRYPAAGTVMERLLMRSLACRHDTTEDCIPCGELKGSHVPRGCAAVASSTNGGNLFLLRCLCDAARSEAVPIKFNRCRETLRRTRGSRRSGCSKERWTAQVRYKLLLL